MKQILHNFDTGKTYLEDVPNPSVKKGHLLIKTNYSLISLGTERMLVQFGQANLINKVRQQPEKVKTVVDKFKTDGFVPTLKAVKNKLSTPISLGYCNVGEVIEIGKDVDGFKIGDLVASNGPHAEIVCVPKNLCAKLPEKVSQKDAVFTVLSSIALQGIRLSSPQLGDTVVVLGLGLIGQITAQLLKINGCKVIGIDIDNEKVKICQNFGIDAINSTETDVVDYVSNVTNGFGADSVLITAASQKSDLVSKAANMCRKKGQVVVVGFVGLDLKRDDFYEKEITFQVSCSYGPGRYDPNYEDKGIDYPYHYIKWTEQRNFQAILDIFSDQKLNVKPLISKIAKLNEVSGIYDNIANDNSLATLIEYNKEVDNKTVIKVNDSFDVKNSINVGIIGAGNYTKSVILPSLKKNDYNIKYIACRSGINSKILAKKFNISNATSDYQNIINDSDIDLIIVSTRHDSHSKIAVDSIKSKKHVFVEKPLALNRKELQDIIANKNKYNQSVNVGYNRRFSPHSKKIKKIIKGHKSPINIVGTMNAGFIEESNWVHDLEIGGGRIIGEACHYFDLFIYLTGSKISSVCMNLLQINELEDNASILLKFENGSNGVINYFSNGPKSYPKEEIKVFSQNKVLTIENFVKTSGFGFDFGKFKTLNTTQDKGQNRQFKLLKHSFTEDGEPIIPFDELVNSTLSSFSAIESYKLKKWVDVDSKL